MSELSDLAAAVAAIEAGGLIAYPTEAVWGLGCDPHNQSAVARLLALKQRPEAKGLILIAASFSQLDELIAPMPVEQRQRLEQQLAQATQAGRPTTWIIPHNDRIPAWICGQHSGVAVRVTEHPVARALCEQFGGLVVSTSANPAGLDPAQSLAEAEAYFADRVDVYVDGPLGQSEQPSAIIDFLSGAQLR